MKLHTIIVTLFLLSFNTNAQLTIDVIAGAGMSGFTETAVKIDTSFHSSKLSFFAGVNAKMNVFKKFYAGASLTYAIKGAGHSPSETSLSYNYLDLSGNIYYHAGKLYAGIGAQVGYLTNSNVAFVEENYQFINLDERKIDFGINLDVQYYVTEQIFVGGNFFYGLNDVYNVHLLDESNNSAGQYYTQNFNGSVYIGYNLFKKNKSTSSE